MEVGFGMMGLLSPILEDPINELREEQLDLIEEAKRVREEEEEINYSQDQGEQDLSGSGNGHVSCDIDGAVVQSVNGGPDSHEGIHGSGTSSQVVVESHGEQNSVTPDIGHVSADENYKQIDGITLHSSELVSVENVYQNSSPDMGQAASDSSIDRAKTELGYDNNNPVERQQGENLVEKIPVEQCDITTSNEVQQIDRNAKARKKANLKLDISPNYHDFSQQGQVGYENSSVGDTRVNASTSVSQAVTEGVSMNEMSESSSGTTSVLKTSGIQIQLSPSPVHTVQDSPGEIIGQDTSTSSTQVEDTNLKPDLDSGQTETPHDGDVMSEKSSVEISQEVTQVHESTGPAVTGLEIQQQENAENNNVTVNKLNKDESVENDEDFYDAETGQEEVAPSADVASEVPNQDIDIDRDKNEASALNRANTPGAITQISVENQEESVESASTEVTDMGVNLGASSENIVEQHEQVHNQEDNSGGSDTGYDVENSQISSEINEKENTGESLNISANLQAEMGVETNENVEEKQHEIEVVAITENKIEETQENNCETQVLTDVAVTAEQASSDISDVWSERARLEREKEDEKGELVVENTQESPDEKSDIMVASEKGNLEIGEKAAEEISQSVIGETEQSNVSSILAEHVENKSEEISPVETGVDVDHDTVSEVTVDAEVTPEEKSVEESPKSELESVTDSVETSKREENETVVKNLESQTAPVSTIQEELVISEIVPESKSIEEATGVQDKVPKAQAEPKLTWQQKQELGKQGEVKQEKAAEAAIASTPDKPKVDEKIAAAKTDAAKGHSEETKAPVQEKQLTWREKQELKKRQEEEKLKQKQEKAPEPTTTSITDKSKAEEKKSEAKAAPVDEPKSPPEQKLTWRQKQELKKQQEQETLKQEQEKLKQEQEKLKQEQEKPVKKKIETKTEEPKKPVEQKLTWRQKQELKKQQEQEKSMKKQEPVVDSTIDKKKASDKAAESSVSAEVSNETEKTPVQQKLTWRQKQDLKKQQEQERLKKEQEKAKQKQQTKSSQQGNMPPSTDNANLLQWPPASPDQRFDERFGDFLVPKSPTKTKDKAKPSKQTRSDGSASPSQSDRSIDGEKLKDDKKAMEYMKERYEGDQEKTAAAKIIRKPKKLTQSWKEGDSVDAEPSPKDAMTLPKEQDLLSYTSVGLEYTKNKYVEKVQEEKDPRKESGAGGSSLPPVVNRCEPEKVAPPEIAKSLRSMFESGNFVDLHRPKKVNPLEEYSSEGGVFENEPEVREDLIRSGDVDEVEMDTTRLKKSGMTKNLLSKWEVPKDEPKKPSKGGKKKDMVEVAEDEGSIAENKPKKRDNVVRGEDTNPTEVLPGKGSAKKAKAKLTTKKEKTKDSQQVKLTESEGAPTVFENEPEDHGDVAREHDDHEQLEFEKGRIKNLTGFFLAQTDDVKVVKKKIIIERDAEPTVLENEPEIRPDVIRSDDISDVDKAIQFEAGRTKNMASFWKTKHDEEESEASKLPKKPVKLDIAKDGASVSENQPQVRPDVVRHDDKEEYIVTGPGHAKNIASRFLKQEDDQEKKPKEKIKLERSEGPCIIENQPVEVQGDIVRATEPGEQVVLESGRTRNLLQHWIATEEDASRPKTSTEAVGQGSKPRWVMEIESARVDKSVYENEPESPDDDIVRAIDEDHSVVVPEKHTKGMANMWKKRQEEEEERERLKRTPQELVRFTPPREKTPPPGQERQQEEEYQRVTLSQPYPEDPPPPQQRRKKKGPQQQRRQQVPADSQTQAHGGQPHSQVVQQPASEPTHPQPHGGQQPRTRAQQQRMRGQQQQQQQQQQHAAPGPKTPVKSQATISLLRK